MQKALRAVFILALFHSCAPKTQLKTHTISQPETIEEYSSIDVPAFTPIELPNQDMGFLSDEILYGDSLLERVDEYMLTGSNVHFGVDSTLIKTSKYVDGRIVESKDYSTSPITRILYDFNPEIGKLERISSYYTNHMNGEDTLVQIQIFLYDELGFEYKVTWEDSTATGKILRRSQIFNTTYNESGQAVFRNSALIVDGSQEHTRYRKYNYDQEGNLTKVYDCQDNTYKNCSLESITTYSAQGRPTLTTYPNNKKTSIKYVYMPYGKMKYTKWAMYDSTANYLDTKQMDWKSYEYDIMDRIKNEHHSVVRGTQFSRRRNFYYREN